MMCPNRTNLGQPMDRPTASVLIVDDDPFFLDYASNVLTDRGGLSVCTANSVDKALEFIDRSFFAVVILDLKMPPGAHFTSLNTAGGYKTGIALAREIKARLPAASLIIHTGGLDREAEEWFGTEKSVTFLYKTPDPNALLRTVNQMLHGRSSVRPFIVHGHDTATLQDLKNFLRDRSGFAEPIILAEQPSLGLTVAEKFEHYAALSDIAFVLMSADDWNFSAETNERQLARARQNVIFELGYFFGYLRRKSGRVILLHRGAIEIPSDLAGIAYIDVTNGIEQASEIIRREVYACLRSGESLA